MTRERDDESKPLEPAAGSELIAELDVVRRERVDALSTMLAMREQRDRYADERDQARAEVEMLRGVGCNEDGDGPCGACLKCARRERDEARSERDEARAQLAAVTEAAEWVCTTLLSDDTGCVEDAIRLAADCERVLADAKAAAEAHDRRLRAAALREAAKALRKEAGHPEPEDGEVAAGVMRAAGRLLEMAIEIERGGAR